MDIQDPATEASVTRTLNAHARKWRLLLVIGAILIVGVIVWRMTASPKDVSAAATPPALTVTITQAQSVPWSATITASGSVAAWQEAIVGAQVAGQALVEVKANVGDVVQRGQLLASFDTATLQAEAAELQAALAQAVATLKQADANRQRAERMRSSGALSEQDILQYLTSADVAQAQVASAQARVASKQLQLSYTKVLAPDAGEISSRSATLGAVAQAGEELFRLIRGGRLEWRGELTAQQLSRIAKGQRIELTLPDGSAATAHVRQTAPAMDAQSRLAIVYADIDTGSRARAGMYANGNITLEQTEALIVPAVSVVIRDGRSYVLTVQGESSTPKVAMQPVTAGRRQGDSIEIAQGLSETDRVVVQGAGFLNDGDVVRVQSDAPTAATPATAVKG
jgi:RND family efflux transporter MFP subunit